MQKVVYSSAEHKATVDVYLTMCKQFAQEVSTKAKYQAYIDVLSTIVDYHNGYGEGVRENNFYDWIMILPINTAVMTNGYFAALETKRNAAVLRAYKVVLEQMLQETVSKLDLLQPTNE